VVSRSAKEVLERLGPDALARVLDDLLDQTRLARLAVACGLRYPGIRTRSQKRDKILADLVRRAGDEDAARKTVLRTLKKESTAAQRSWSRLDPEERSRRLKDEAFLGSDGNLGRHLFLLAVSPPSPEVDQALETLRSRRDLRPAASAAGGADVASLGPLKKEIARLKKQNTQLSKKFQHVESQLAKSRETEKGLKKDIIRRKGEIAEARLLAERLRNELDSRGESSRVEAKAAGPSDGAVESLSKTVKRLASEQRKLIHALSRRSEAPTAPAALPEEALAPVVELLDELRKEGAAARRERKKRHDEQAKRLDKLREEMAALRKATDAAPKSRTAARRGKTSDRVGVFIDVQNMYYGARQLKGKLDFDALLQAAVRERRLIEATAYMVESKEIDQSGFISLLQTRAITVRRKTLKVRADGSMKGDWDMEMALDILDAAGNLDVIVLVSGDGDFTSLVKRVKEIGPRVEVVAFPRNTAKSLLGAADRFQPLDRKFMIRSESTASPRRKPAKPRRS
jgi:uncharacterized LabA/DUF88 family protein